MSEERRSDGEEVRRRRHEIEEARKASGTPASVLLFRLVGRIATTRMVHAPRPSVRWFDPSSGGWRRTSDRRPTRGTEGRCGASPSCWHRGFFPTTGRHARSRHASKTDHSEATERGRKRTDRRVERKEVPENPASLQGALNRRQACIPRFARTNPSVGSSLDGELPLWKVGFLLLLLQGLGFLLCFGQPSTDGASLLRS